MNNMDIKFKNAQHEERYEKLRVRMKNDVYRLPLAYLFALNDECYRHINDLYNFNSDSINPAGLETEWQTGTSLKFTKLAFNLYNGWEQCNVSDVFACSDGVYMLEAVKIRFPEWCGDKNF